MMWVPFSAAVSEVQRQLGIPLLKANEALFAAIDNDEVTSRWDEDDLFVLDTSVLDWIKKKQRREKEKRAALDLWADRLHGIVSGGADVVSIGAKR
jgi:hypothetical protein